ncbi:MAG: hypothetical protein N3B16_04145, partial [Candidatus Aminicenantes bacterium]|nr:hypothetical protein [Candidatus Aminicenantes bacterium]
MAKFKNKLFRLAIALILISFVFCFYPLPLAAWKTIVHTHLTLICRQDALDDGKLIIYEMDYENGRIKLDDQGRPVEIGRYEIDPLILQAIRQYPDHLKAGVVGTDVLPDLITAQTIVHPDNS